MSDEQQFVTGVLLIAVGLTATLLLVWRTRRFLSRAARVSGRISHISVETRHYKGHGANHPEETTMYYAPHVESSSEDGSLLGFAGSELAGNSLYKQGDVVPVVAPAPRARPCREARPDWHLGERVLGHRVLSTQRIHRPPEQGQRPRPPEVLVDPGKANRDVGRPRRWPMDGVPGTVMTWKHVTRHRNHHRRHRAARGGRGMPSSGDSRYCPFRRSRR